MRTTLQHRFAEPRNEKLRNEPNVHDRQRPHTKIAKRTHRSRPAARYNNHLRYFFSRRVPHPHRVLLIESGSRGVIERLLPLLPGAFGQVEIDLVTCYVDQPAGFTGLVFNVNEYGGPSGRDRLLSDLAARDYQLTGLLCTAEPIMTKWKWWLAWKLPVKVFIINENADFFWCDWSHFNVVWNFALERAGLTGGAAVPALARLLFLPVTVSFLLAYAGTVHLRRRIRLL
jgi:hypothetical protein